ncbi:MAG TPA: hypothetical protein VGH44_05635 [Candidatus Saccharimonadia bacterium]
MSDKDPATDELAEKERPEKAQPEKKVKTEEWGRPVHPGGERFFYSEMTRVVTMLFVGVMALMTFLLTVGLQRPHGMFKEALYTALALLPLNLIAFVFGNLLSDNAKRLRIVRFVQMLLFVLTVLAVTWFAYTAAQFFFNLPSQPAQPM